jgi:hydrogenase nickel incorporation protein HypA/HybF
MHELAITRSMLDLVLEHAEKAGAEEVGRINLVIGEMTGVVEQSVRFYLGFLGKGTPAEKAELNCRIIPIKARCLECHQEFEPKDYDWTCPNCESNNIDIIGGKELFVESIEVR